MRFSPGWIAAGFVIVCCTLIGSCQSPAKKAVEEGKKALETPRNFLDKKALDGAKKAEPEKKALEVRGAKSDWKYQEIEKKSSEPAGHPPQVYHSVPVLPGPPASSWTPTPIENRPPTIRIEPVPRHTAADPGWSLAVYPVAGLIPNGDLDTLTQLVTKAVRPSSWSGSGGPGMLESYRPAKLLIVAQSTEVHQEIRSFLSTLGRLQGISWNHDREETPPPPMLEPTSHVRPTGTPPSAPPGPTGWVSRVFCVPVLQLDPETKQPRTIYEQRVGWTFEDPHPRFEVPSAVLPKVSDRSTPNIERIPTEDARTMPWPQ